MPPKARITGTAGKHSDGVGPRHMIRNNGRICVTENRIYFIVVEFGRIWRSSGFKWGSGVPGNMGG